MAHYKIIMTVSSDKLETGKGGAAIMYINCIQQWCKFHLAGS